MFYPLRACDTRAPLGAGFGRRPDGAVRVDTVERGSFAAGMGLRAGDVVLQVGVGSGKDNRKYYSTAAEINEFLATLPTLEPALYRIGFKVQRSVLIPTGGLVRLELELPTTLRNNPALALFMGTDREWVLWTPQGYYDTSIEGDARFLGWHINPPFGTTLPTDFVPIGTFAETMNRSGVLDRLWRTGVLDPAAIRQAAVPVPPAPAPPAPAVVPPAAPVRPPTVVAVEDQPPRIVFGRVQDGIPLPAPGVLWTVDRPDVGVTIRITATGKSPIVLRRIVLDERPVPRDPNIARVAELTEQVPLAGLVPNRRIRLAVEAANAAGGQRTETIDLVYVPVPKPEAPKPTEPPVPSAPRLHLLAIGCDRFASGLPPIEYAGQDAQALAGWLADHLTSADGARPAAGPPSVLAGEKASVRSISDACDRLNALVRNKQVREHDIVAVVIASHLVASPQGTLIAAADTVAGSPPRPAVPAAELCEVLGQLTAYGCRVAVFVDGVHKLDEPQQAESKPFVRDLQRKRGVITFIASKEGPSGVDRNKEHGRFALGILQAFDAADLGGTRKDRSGAYTLDQFRAALVNEVFNLSGRRQQAGCYIPNHLSEATLFASPRK
jgi:hypothetical protein